MRSSLASALALSRVFELSFHSCSISLSLTHTHGFVIFARHAHKFAWVDAKCLISDNLRHIVDGRQKRITRANFISLFVRCPFS